MLEQWDRCAYECNWLYHTGDNFLDVSLKGNDLFERKIKHNKTTHPWHCDLKLSFMSPLILCKRSFCMRSDTVRKCYCSFYFSIQCLQGRHIPQMFYFSSSICSINSIHPLNVQTQRLNFCLRFLKQNYERKKNQHSKSQFYDAIITLTALWMVSYI